MESFREQVRPQRLSTSISLLLLLLLGCLSLHTLAQPVDADDVDADLMGKIIYDQRQSGKYNIHVSIKDVAIIEMDQNEIQDESYGEDDYYYDDSVLTVKPIHLSLTPAPVKNITTTTSTTAAMTSASTNKQTIVSTAPTGTSSRKKSTVTATLSIPTSSSSRNTYSPNLLADIAATQKFYPTHNITVTTSIPQPRKTPNVVIVPSSSKSPTTSTHQPPPVRAVEILGRSKDIPILSALDAPQSQSLTTTITDENVEARDTNQSNQSVSEQTPQVNLHGDSKIYKFKVRRAHKQVGASGNRHGASFVSLAHNNRGRAGCRLHQYRDVSGNCRNKRSSSLLKKLFSMLVTLPFAHDQLDNDDE